MGNPAPSQLTAEQFGKRLVQLCIGSGMSGLPRRYRDQQLLLKSVVLTLNRRLPYTEKQIDLALEDWLTDIAPSIYIDRTNLRRWLVDEGYLERERDGSHYWVGSAAEGDELFDDEIDELDVYQLIREGKAAIQQKKQEHLEQQESVRGSVKRGKGV